MRHIEVNDPEGESNTVGHSSTVVITPYQYQLDAARELCGYPGRLIADERGCGKTVTGILLDLMTRVANGVPSWPSWPSGPHGVNGQRDDYVAHVAHSSYCVARGSEILGNYYHPYIVPHTRLCVRRHTRAHGASDRD